MKLSMKALIAVSALFFGFTAQSASAQTSCLIAVSLPCKAAPSIVPMRAFADSEGYATVNAGRCLERAAEYRNWCGLPNQTVNVVFTVNGRGVVGAFASNDGKTYIHDGVARYTRFKD